MSTTAADGPETTMPSQAVETAVASGLPAGPPFGPEFFAAVLGDRVRTACDGHPEGVPVVELHLADGMTLDLCHIPALERQWLAAQVYRDKETCEEMDLMFVPYGLITRVTVSIWHRSQRPIGFRLTPPAGGEEAASV